MRSVRKTFSLLDNFISEKSVEVFSAIYGPSNLSAEKFIRFFNLISLSEWRKLENSLNMPSSVIKIKDLLLQNPDALITSNIWAKYPERMSRFCSLIENHMALFDRETLPDRYPLLWICFPKKEFTPPVWHIIPGQSAGPVHLGMYRTEVLSRLGQPESIPTKRYENYLNGHLKIQYTREYRICRIKLDRIGNWNRLITNDALHQIHHFRPCLLERFPFEEISFIYNDHIVHNLFYRYKHVHRLVNKDQRYKTLDFPKTGISITFFNRDYYNYPLTEINIYK